ncbi:hypothetical protein SmJEL517_g04992 [Synchytrium microbalum]|uniref:Phosphodiesterase n=1 Tax=Synchytrium microbalum TaxID=1806994 RepID=A0A507C2I6_9FUNG|nr:uncharacterized protein SmJEL517_g04992 [Synchytrium microbalum]TPX31723.1 hypothetical protein SmJEL517_g04992 [Synchytrium microbalum]
MNNMTISAATVGGRPVQRQPSMWMDGKELVEDLMGTVRRNTAPRSGSTSNLPAGKRAGLRGPVLVQMGIHYMSFLVLLFVAYQTAWAPSIRFYMTLFYFLLVLFVMEVARMNFARNATAVWPYYLSLAPFGVLIFISREAHQLAMVLWYASFLIIYLQSGHEKLHLHLILYSICFGVVYLVTVYIMTTAYVSGCLSWACAVALTDPIVIEYELVLLAACAVMVLQFMSLQHFIKMNAEKLLQRENYVKFLWLANVDLKKQLRRAEKDKEVDLEAPLSRATQILREVKFSFAEDETVMQQLDVILGILASDSLFSPQVLQKTDDADVHDWLKDMLLADNNDSDHGSVKNNTGSLRHPSTAARNSTPLASHHHPLHAGHTSQVNINKDALLVAPMLHISASTPEESTNALIAALSRRPSVTRELILPNSNSIVLFNSPSLQDPIRLSTFNLLPDSSPTYTLLEDIGNPNFDMFEFDKATNNQPLFYLGWHIFQKHGFGSKLNIPDDVIKNWLLRIEMGYKSTNPYHTAVHAADVTQAMHYFATRDRIWPHLTTEEKFAAVVAPIIHDYNHPGVNNAFLVATANPLALRYNDQCILEHYHSASVFEIMANYKECDIFCGLSPEGRKSVREMIVSMVLATDMSQHFDLVGKFKTKLNSTEGFNLLQKLDRKLLLNISIKCADVNNPSKPLAMCRKWTDLIMEEFFRQGDEERSRGLPISAFMNRETTDIPKCQMGFLDYIVTPLYETYGGFMKEDVQPHLDNLASNRAYWKGRSEKFQQQPSQATIPLSSSSQTPSLINPTASATTTSAQAISTSSRASSTQNLPLHSPQSSTVLTRGTVGRNGSSDAGAGASRPTGAMRASGSFA